MIEKRNKLGQIKKTGKWVKCFNCNILVYKQKRTLLLTKKYYCSHKCYLNWLKQNHQINFDWWNNKKVKSIIIEKISESMKGKHNSLKTEIKESQHLSSKTEIKSGEHKSLETEFKKGHKPSHGWKKGNKFPFEIEQIRIKNSIKSNRRKTIPEKRLEKIIKKSFPNTFIYTGNGKEMIELFNPDFIDIKNKKIIEMFGDYWHNLPKQKKKDYFRFKVYKRNGYKTLIIWEHELKDINKVKNKIRRLLYDS